MPKIEVDNPEIRQFIISYLNIITTYTESTVSLNHTENLIIIDDPEIMRGNEINVDLLKKKYEIEDLLVNRILEAKQDAGSCGIQILVGKSKAIEASVTILNSSNDFQEKIRCIEISIGEMFGFRQKVPTKEGRLIMPMNILALSAMKICESEDEFDTCIKGVLEAYILEIGAAIGLKGDK
ncbi:hypothetical protein K1718_20940 [Roseibium porphyridii]|uniref:Uncharacterized protein n=1 Tax=Roseibium porphyridii TaxID=2866279 RepID=A0ABY8F7E1_9HYPH|nr:hypothetical protein [Roseibium sp. KMA01]WFE88608.1 hypothetical protein K1718_20940 [Roseibium sp. KMA01]